MTLSLEEFRAMPCQNAGEMIDTLLTMLRLNHGGAYYKSVYIEIIGDKVNMDYSDIPF